LANSKNYEAPHYVIFSTLLLLQYPDLYNTILKNYELLQASRKSCQWHMVGHVATTLLWINSRLQVAEIKSLIKMGNI
jgi:hypothetical protein